MCFPYLNHKEWVMLHHHVSTVAQNQTLALERAIHILMLPEGSCSITIGKGEVHSLLQSATSPLDATKSYTLVL